MTSAVEKAVAFHAGITPNTRPTTSAAAAQKAATRTSKVSATLAGSNPSGTSDGATLRMAAPIPVPSAPPITASTRLSVTSCRTMRRRPAPSAERTASSRVRTVARASSRLATLAQQMRSTNPTTPRKSIDVERQIAADDRVVQALEHDAAALVGLRELLRQPAGDGFEVGFGRLDRCVWLQASDHLEDVGGAGARRHVDERPHRPDAALPQQLEVFRHDADHRKERSVEADLAADDARIGVEARAPERLAHHDHVGALGLVLGGERPAGNRL